MQVYGSLFLLLIHFIYKNNLLYFLGDSTALPTVVCLLKVLTILCYCHPCSKADLLKSYFDQSRTISVSKTFLFGSEM